MSGGSGVRKGHLAARLFVRSKRKMLSYCFKTMVSEEPIMTSLSVHHQTEGKKNSRNSKETRGTFLEPI